MAAPRAAPACLLLFQAFLQLSDNRAITVSISHVLEDQSQNIILLMNMGYLNLLESYVYFKKYTDIVL